VYEQLSEPVGIGKLIVAPAELVANELIFPPHEIVGKILSTTVTIAVPVAILLLISLTVNVTVFAPRFEQLNEVFDNVVDEILQLSVDPLFICDGVILAVPKLLKATVMFCVTTVGAVLSIVG
jgi:hypothetical protein